MSKRRRRAEARRGVRVGLRNMFQKLERPLPDGIRLPAPRKGSDRTVAAREQAKQRAATNGKRRRT